MSDLYLLLSVFRSVKLLFYAKVFARRKFSRCSQLMFDSSASHNPYHGPRQLSPWHAHSNGPGTQSDVALSRAAEILLEFHTSLSMRSILFWARLMRQTFGEILQTLLKCDLKPTQTEAFRDLCSIKGMMIGFLRWSTFEILLFRAYLWPNLIDTDCMFWPCRTVVISSYVGERAPYVYNLQTLFESVKMWSQFTESPFSKSSIYRAILWSSCAVSAREVFVVLQHGVIRGIVLVTRKRDVPVLSVGVKSGWR